MLNSLSGRFLVLTIVFVMLAEVSIFVPTVARYRVDFLLSRLERAQIASLALLADDMITPEVEQELLRNAGVYNVALRRSDTRQLVLSSPVPEAVSGDFDLRNPGSFELIRDALRRLADPRDRVIRVMGNPVQDAGQMIEITLSSGPLRMAMIDYGLRVLGLSVAISLVTALLIFLAVRRFLVMPIKRVIGHMQRYASAPQDGRTIISPSATITELREAENALYSLQMELSAALKQQQRRAQLGEAVAKVSHDLRNILTSAQLFTDRIEMSEDPSVQRLAPKLVGSMQRAINLCESTLAFGRAEEPAPSMQRFMLCDVTQDVVDGERLAAAGHDISFAEDVAPGLTVRADPEQLYRVLSNLIRNARQAIIATGEPGEISLSAENRDGTVFIRVADTGPGIPKKAQQTLFTPFQSSARKGGSGLGLAISHELVAGHGGSLRLVTSDESGTVFEIALPQGDIADA